MSSPDKKGRRRRRREEEDDEKEEEVKEDKVEQAGKGEEEDVDGNRILVRNETDFDIKSGDSFLHIRDSDGRGRGRGKALPAHSTVDLTEYHGWTLSIDRVGFVFRGDVQVKDDETNKDKDPYWGKPRVVLSELGGVFHVIEDPDSRPVTEEEAASAPDLIEACLECGGRVPPPFRDTTQDCWVWIATQLGRRPDEADHVKEGMKAGLSSSSRWNKLYDERCAILPAGAPHAEELRELMLEKKSVGIVVYFRALDRFPGGNADCAVLKFKIQFDLTEDKQTEAEDWRASWMVYRNYDGNASITRQPVERESLPHSEVVTELLQPLADLISACDARTVDTIIIEHAMDNEESDTEWSSVEVLVYVPQEHAGAVGVQLVPSGSSSSSSPSSCSSTMATSNKESFLVKAKDTSSSSCLVKEEWPLAFRLHQRAVPVKKEQKKKRLNSKVNAKQEAHAKRVVKGASTLFQMNTVETALEHMKDPADHELEEFRDIYVPPIFMPEP